MHLSHFAKLVVVGAALTSMGVVADKMNHTGFYVGAGVGLLSQSVEMDSTLMEEYGLDGGSPRFKIKKIAGQFSISGGYNIHHNEYKLGMDLAMGINFGEANHTIKEAALATLTAPGAGLGALPVPAKLPTDDWMLKLKREYQIAFSVRPGLYFANHRGAFYGIFGVGFSTFKLTAIVDPSTDLRSEVTKKYQAIGATVGAGMEYNFNSSISAHLEYTYQQYKALDFKKHTFAGEQTLKATFSPQYHSVILGVRYKF